MKYAIVSSNYHGEVQEVIGPFATWQKMTRWMDKHNKTKRFENRTWVLTKLCGQKEAEKEE